MYSEIAELESPPMAMICLWYLISPKAIGVGMIRSPVMITIIFPSFAYWCVFLFSAQQSCCSFNQRIWYHSHWLTTVLAFGVFGVNCRWLYSFLFFPLLSAHSKTVCSGANLVTGEYRQNKSKGSTQIYLFFPTFSQFCLLLLPCFLIRL